MDALRMVQDPSVSALDRNLAVSGYHDNGSSGGNSLAPCARKERNKKKLELLSLQAIDFFPSPSPPPSPSTYMIRTDSISSLSCDSVSLCSTSAMAPLTSPLSAASTFSSSSSMLDSALLYEQLTRHPSYCPILPSPRRVKPADMSKVWWPILCLFIVVLYPDVLHCWLSAV